MLTLDEAREAVDKALPYKADFTVERDGADLLVVIRDITISYNELAALGVELGTLDIKLENTTCEKGYYGDHTEGQTALRVVGVLSEPPPKPEPVHRGNLCCSFCGKSQRKVKKLIAGPAVYICNECVKLCQEIIDEEEAK